MGGIGHGLLLTGTVVAAAAALAATRRSTRRASTPLLVAAALAFVGSVTALGIAFVGNDFSLAYVADQARRHTSWWYRVAGIWGGMDGSLLLWTVLLAVSAAAAALALHRHERELSARTAGITAAVVAAFGTVTAGWASPFAVLATPPIDGLGLVPILEHPAMVVHPPLLYLGLTSTLALAGLAVAASRDDDPGRVHRRLRRWGLVSWTLLSAGMALGARWSSVEAGWGGFWAWDPIENGSLLPWLALTALLHARPPAVRRTTPAAVAVAAFLLATAGTTLTRAGVVPSVHAFATAPPAAPVLVTLTVALTLGLVPPVARAGWNDRRRAPDAVPTWTGDPGALRMLLALLGAMAVLVGSATFLPAVWSAAGRAAAVTDAAFYTTWLVPLAAAVLVVLALGARLGPGPRRPQLGSAAITAALGGVATLAAFVLAGWRSLPPLLLGALAGAAATTTVVAAVRSAPDGRRPAAASTLAHLGLALLLLGLAGSANATRALVPLVPDQEVTVGSLAVRSSGARATEGSEPAVLAPIEVRRVAGWPRGDATLTPSIVGYPALGVRVAETARWSTPAADVTVVLERADDDGRVVVTIIDTPLAALVWTGALLLVTGGVVGVGRQWRRRATADDQSGADPASSASAPAPVP